MRVSKSTGLVEVQTELKPMTIAEQIRQIMLTEELPDNEKLDRLDALIPLEVFKIDNVNQATPAQLKQLKEGFIVTENDEDVGIALSTQCNRSGVPNYSQRNRA
jgi:DNA polymerase III psi subunit